MIVSTLNPAVEKRQSKKNESCQSLRSTNSSATLVTKLGGTRLSQHGTEESTLIETVTCGDTTIQYCYITQRGFYPDDPNKENQDSYCLYPMSVIKGVNAAKVAFFGVFDGHGNFGHNCAQFVKDELPKTLFEKLGMAAANGVKSTEKAIIQAHKLVSDRLLKNPQIDTKLSGTTSISVLFRDGTMYVSNVGDSRAIIISQENDGKLKASALSSDHTPYREDERLRVMKYGAKILSLTQLRTAGAEVGAATTTSLQAPSADLTLGEDIDQGGDPPRIWAKVGEYPGTAFSRSFGDSLAEEVGVTAEPEVLVREVRPQDKYVILASDGVFEFLTNQVVADIVGAAADPMAACRAVVGQAYDMWMRHDGECGCVWGVCGCVDSGR